MKEKKITANEAKKLFGEDAAKMAKEVCGVDKCSGCFECGHTNKSGFLMPKHGDGDKCPLEKYNVEPDTRTFRERLEAGEYNPDPEENLNGLFALCALCEHSGVVEKDGFYELERTDEVYRQYCLDCPVNMTREGIEENLAEAAMS